MADLTFFDLTWNDAAIILDYFPNVRRLSIRGIDTFRSGEEADTGFPAALAGCAFLEHFALLNDLTEGPEDALNTWPLPSTWDAFVGRFGPALRTLKFSVGDQPLGRRDWLFIERCAQSVERLDLELDCIWDVQGIRAVLNSTPFPHLRHLRLTCEIDAATLILGRLSACTPSLTSLFLSLTAPNLSFRPPPLSPTLLHLLPALAPTITLSLSHLFPSIPPSLLSFCNEHHITLHTDRSDDPHGASDILVEAPSFLLDDDPRSLAEKRQEGTTLICDVVADALQFGIDRIERVRRDADFEGAMEMIPLVDGLVGRMRIERD